MKRNGPLSLKNSLWLYFTAIAVICSVVLSIFLYRLFNTKFLEQAREKNTVTVENLTTNLNTYFLDLLNISDSIYFNSLKNRDLNSDRLTQEFKVICDSNKSRIQGIALFDGKGGLIASRNGRRLNPYRPVREASWFEAAVNKRENLHFSQPVIQNLFTDASQEWVILLSRAVDLQQNGLPVDGVLVMQLRLSQVVSLLNNGMNNLTDYTYLTDQEGHIIYHPYITLIGENASPNPLPTGETYEIERPLAYTGWELVGHFEQQALSPGIRRFPLTVGFVISLTVTVIFIANNGIANRLSRPLKRMERDIKAYEEGNHDIRVRGGGCAEIRDLAGTLNGMIEEIDRLVDQVRADETVKRRYELDTLQNQINPHFLYNTLGIIVWMIENEKRTQAIEIINALSRLFRIALSDGRTTIRLEEEVEHVRNYLLIQSARFKGKFTFDIHIDDDVRDCACLKLILQPLAENAVYHEMQFSDGDGRIEIHAFREGDQVILRMFNNGNGMREELVNALNQNTYRSEHKSRHGGVGFNNVKERLNLYTGSDHAMVISSEPDEGTTVEIRLPRRAYEEVERETI